MDVLRHTARATLSELAGPGEPRDGRGTAPDRRLRRGRAAGDARRATAAAGPEGAQMKQDLLDFVDGINAYIAEARSDPDKMPVEYPALGKQIEDWKPTDTVAIASLIGGIFGKGGGEEARVSLAYQAIRKRFGRRGGERVYQDFRDFDNREAPTTVHKRFPFYNPGRPKRKALAMIDPGSFQEADPIVSGEAPSESASRAAVHPAARGVERPAGRPARVEVGHADRRDGPAGRLLLAADPDGDGDPRAGRAARPRRDLPGDQPLRAARPRPGLRLERDDREHRRRRSVRREALRAGRLGADDRVASTTSTRASACRSRCRSGSSRPRRRSRT